MESLSCLKLSTSADCGAWWCRLSHYSEAPCLRFRPNSRCAGTATSTSHCSRPTTLHHHGAPCCQPALDTQQHSSRGYRLSHCRSMHRTLTPYWYNHSPPQNVNAVWANFDFLLNIGVFTFFSSCRSNQNMCFLCSLSGFVAKEGQGFIFLPALIQ